MTEEEPRSGNGVWGGSSSRSGDGAMADVGQKEGVATVGSEKRVGGSMHGGRLADEGGSNGVGTVWRRGSSYGRWDGHSCVGSGGNFQASQVWREGVPNKEVKSCCRLKYCTT